MLSSRQKLILKAIVEEYIRTAQPIGSKYLTEVPYLNVSSATLRYDMAILETLGYLEKTHTSSGRLPSELGYKYYVNHLVTRDSDVEAQFPMIDEMIHINSVKRDHAIESSIKLLSELTQYTTMAVGSKQGHISIKKIDFIPLTDSKATLLIVTNQGHVEHQTIDVTDQVNMEDMKEVMRTLNDLLSSKTLEEASDLLQNVFNREDLKAYMAFEKHVLDAFVEAFTKFTEQHVMVSGMTHLFDQPEFDNTAYMKKFMDMLDKKELVKLIGHQEGLQVRFGSELQLIPMEHCTLISIPYQISENETGTIALIGPNRMPYNKVIPLLEYVALNLGKLYKK
jgi:heat-inducible transcriptional repressor